MSARSAAARKTEGAVGRPRAPPPPGQRARPTSFFVGGGARNKLISAQRIYKDTKNDRCTKGRGGTLHASSGVRRGLLMPPPPPSP